MTDFREQVTFTFISSHKGGQHTNGPDYGVLRCEHGLTGNAVELQTHRRLRQHQAREIGVTLLELAAANYQGVVQTERRVRIASP